MPELLDTIHRRALSIMACRARRAALSSPDRLRRILAKMLDENESSGRTASLAVEVHEQNPYV